jgi:2-methylcitrate dehydratase PrpD
MQIEDRLSQFVAETSLEDIPDETVEFTKHLLLKTAAGTIAGSQTPSGESVYEYIETNANQEDAPVLGAGFKTSAEDAALANGYFSHAAELEDDQFPVATSDITVIPVVLALVERLDLTGHEIVETTAVAMEAMNRVGSFPVTHLGYSDLPFYGVIGAQAAAAKAYGFDQERTKDMLGFGIAQSSGWRINFGTAAHYWESAVPCRNAISSAELVKKGADSNPDLEEWITTLIGDDIDVETITEGLGSDWQIHQTAIKKYPVCFLTHRQIDTLRELRDAHDLSAENVESIATVVGPIDEIVDRPDPTTVDDARFSLQHVLATVMLNGGIWYSDLQPKSINDPDVKALRSKVEVEVRDDWPAEFNSGTIHVAVRTTDGEVYEKERRDMIGGPNEPLSTEEMRALYRQILENYYDQPLLTSEQIDRTADAILDLENETDPTDLFEALTSETA